MAAQSAKKSSKRGVRQGTATRRAGKETAARLVQAAYELLETEHYERFSMRNVAERAGVSLANLQYYFPRREDLAQALSHHMDSVYRTAYEECLIDAPASPKERFKLILRYNMQEISKRSTRQYFIQLWALLGSMDDFAGHHLSELYAIDIKQLSEHIEAIYPDVGTGEIRKRATLIAAMIEGLMVVMGDTSQDKKLTENLLDYAFETALAIADGVSM